MDENYQNGSTAVAEVPQAKGEVKKGSEEPATVNGPHHSHTTDQGMNGTTETEGEEVKETGNLVSKGEDEKPSVEKDKNGLADTSEANSESGEAGNKDENSEVDSGSIEKPVSEVRDSEEKLKIDNKANSSDELESEPTNEAKNESPEVDTTKDEGKADVIENENEVESISETNKELQNVTDSVAEKVNSHHETADVINEDVKAEQNDNGKDITESSVVSGESVISEQDAKENTGGSVIDQDNSVGNNKEKGLTERLETDGCDKTEDSNLDISMAESDDLKNNTNEINKSVDESQNMSVESTEAVPAAEHETTDEMSLVLSESEPSLKEEKDSSDKMEIDTDSPKSSLNETDIAQTTEIGKVKDKSDINESKSEQSDPISEISKSGNIEESVKSNKLDTSTALLTSKLTQEKTVMKNTSKLKSKTLDQVLSKITSIAENENQQKAEMKVIEAQSQGLPKKAKARKSCAPIRPPSPPTQNKTSITSLTFNVKELEKQGLLDIPKAQKRKAFEPMKIKSGVIDDTEDVISQDETSNLKSPHKSSGKTEKSTSRKKKLSRKKKGKRGGYLLPGEKQRKKTRKKESEDDSEGQLSKTLQENTDQPKHSETVPPLRITQKQLVKNEPSNSHLEKVSPQRSLLFQSSLGKSQTVETTTAQNNVLNVLSVTNRPLAPQTPSNSVKKAKKSVKAANSTRKIDSFFIGGNSNQAVKQPQSPDSLVSAGSKDSDHRKRKAQGSIPCPNATPEEKKRKMDEAISPAGPQLIRLVPTGTPGVGMPKFPGSGNPILLTPGASGAPQTIIQNGTLNGLPMFQIVNGPNGATSQPQQLVALSTGQGQSLLQSSFPRTTTLLQTSGVPGGGMPVILGPVSLQTVVNSQIGSQSQVSSSSAVISSANVLTSVHGTRLVPVSSALSGQQCSEVGNLVRQNPVYLSNGQLLDQTKLVSKNGSLPNGLYPVTPPKTPENNSAQESRESVELSPGGTALPDKDVIPLCTCKINGANFQKLASLVTYCQALDSVDGKVMGCCNKVTSTQVVRPAVKVPFLSLCESHRKRLRIHQCCPGCGHFCTQGKFLQCKKDGSNSLHLFHEQCLIVKDGKNYCPHCGETSAHVEVHLSLEESKPSVMKESKSSRVQLKARITAKTATLAEEKTEEPAVSFTLEKTKKTISASDIPIGPDKHSLEKILACLGQERPKKFRHLPKCLYTPAYDQDLERTLYMLEDGHNPNEKYEDLENQGALHAAATVGSLPVVHVLVQAGASCHLQDRTLRTPLMYAAENNHLDVVKYLVKAGSIVDSKADDGMTALHYAAKAGHIDVLSVLLDSERIFVDVTDDGGWTPLIWAVEHDQTDSVKLLLKRNADPNLRDSEENTTLHWAAFSGSVVIAELLLTAGCDLDSLNMHGDRPLHIAARQDHYECVVLFLARGADVEAKNNKSETPEECCVDKTTAVFLALKVNRQLKKFGAKHMGRPEKLVHRDLSKGRENIPIPCVNAVDDEGVPQDYLYVTDNIETTSLHVNRVIGSLQSCQCKDDCSSIYCACGKNSVKCWYDKFARLIPEFNMVEPPLIFECNRACTCWTTCNNRVVQNGVMSRLQVFKTDGRGWGCKTLVDIQRGTFICEYIGEHISDSEADRREDDSYLFDLDNRDGETYCIDARKYGNIARFINHLCEPNLVPVKVFVDSQDLRFPRICLFASRDIMAGEELGFDYGEKFWIIKWKHFTCTCGSHKCRYSKETIQKTLEEYYLRHDDEEAEVVNEGQTGVERAPDKPE